MGVGQGLGSFWNLGPGSTTECPPHQGLQSQETGPCSFVYKCRVAFGEQGWGQSVSKRKGKSLGVKTRGFAHCFLLKSLCLLLCKEEK